MVDRIEIVSALSAYATNWSKCCCPIARAQVSALVDSVLPISSSRNSGICSSKSTGIIVIRDVFEHRQSSLIVRLPSKPARTA